MTTTSHTQEPMDPTIRAHNLIGLMDDIMDVLERENALLDRPVLRELKPVVDEKQALFRLYEEQVRELSGQSDFADTLDVDLKDRLTDLARRFEDMMKTNEIKLNAMTRSSQMIVDRITSAAQQAAASASGYGRSGGAYQNGKAAPVAINREL